MYKYYIHSNNNNYYLLFILLLFVFYTKLSYTVRLYLHTLIINFVPTIVIFIHNFF